MLGDSAKYIAVFFTGLVVSYILTPWVRAWATRLGAVDQPSERRPHQRPTARGGGLAIILAVHAACFVALVLPWPQFAGDLNLRWWGSFTISSVILLVVGVIDDLRGLRPTVKLAGQVLAALLVALSGVHFGKLLTYDLPPALDTLLVVFYLVAIINAFNLIDGLDGLACGLAIISALGMCGLFVIGHMPGNVLVLLGLIGACVGFLRYNFHPASVFMGDTGSMFLGFSLGVISLQTFSKSTFLLSASIPLMVLGVPIFDEVLAIWRRSIRMWLITGPLGGGSRRRGIMQPDLEHLHHRLLKAGLSTRRVALTLCILNGVLVAVGLLMTSFQSHAAGIFLVALLAGVYVLMRHLAVTELRDTGSVILNGLRRPTHATFKALGYPVWDMFWMASTLAFAMSLFEEPRADFWHAWFLDLPIWVTPTFSLLAASRTYVTVWTRARGLDVLMLMSTLLVGLGISLSLAMLIDPANTHVALLKALLLGTIANPAIVAARVVYRFTEEFVLYLRNRTLLKTGGGRVLLYGAGGRCQLFLKEQGFSNSSSFDGKVIVGLLDDEPALHNQWVYGYPVLGGLKQLPNLITLHHLTGIIITTDLRPETLEALRQLAKANLLQLSEWRFENRPVSLVSAL